MTGSGGDRSPSAEACPLPIGDKSVSAIPTKLFLSHTGEGRKERERESGREGREGERKEERGKGGGDERSRRVCEVALISIRLSLSLSLSPSLPLPPSRRRLLFLPPPRPRHWERQTLRVTLNEIESSRNEKTKRGEKRREEEAVGSPVIRVKKEGSGG